MERTTSEKIMMNINRLANAMKPNGRPEEKDKRPEPSMGMPPVGPAGMPPMGPPPEIRTLVLLKTVEKEMKKPEIGMILGLPPKANNQSLDRLAEKGLIALKRDPEDEKGAYISITEAGIAKLEQDKREKRERADAFLKNLTEEEKETLLALLEKIKK